mmetsp:Transcript_17566/g.15408  ORF Transcript_17566/g.15408 Transcript_17566/m.15408 type:complete len:93 (+) Transcript_17566:51-329(+)
MRTVAVKMVAAFAFGGGVLGAAFTAYTLYDVHRKVKDMKETHSKIVEKGPKIEGIKSEKDASKALEAVEISFRDLIKELEAKSEKVEGLLKD